MPKASEIVADHIRGQIIKCELKEGDFLPPEGQLMTTLGVSRPTLREAFRILEAESLISVVKGSRTGARVHSPSTELVSRYAGYVLQAAGTTISDLYQARLAIEPQVVRWLAGKPNRTAIRRLRAETERLGILLNAGRTDDFYRAINTFHGELVGAGGNKTLTFLNQMLLDLIARHQFGHRRQFPVLSEGRKRRSRAAVRSYEKLIDLIDAGQADEAVKHWRLHLTNASSAWIAEGEGARVVNSLGPINSF